VGNFRLALAGEPYYGITVPTITFKVTPEEAASLRARARAARRTLSEFLRDQVLGKAHNKKTHLEPSKKTGILVISQKRHPRRLTSEKVSELLSDFP
jgi:hypothetical protein